MKPMLALVVVQFAVTVTPVAAQGYPNKPVRLLLPSSAGSGADTIGRIVATSLTNVMKQQVIVENRPGGNSNIGAAAVAKSPADGYTLTQVNIAHAANMTVYRNLPYVIIADQPAEFAAHIKAEIAKLAPVLRNVNPD